MIGLVLVLVMSKLSVRLWAVSWRPWSTLVGLSRKPIRYVHQHLYMGGTNEVHTSTSGGVGQETNEVQHQYLYIEVHHHWVGWGLLYFNINFLLQQDIDSVVADISELKTSANTFKVCKTFCRFNFMWNLTFRANYTGKKKIFFFLLVNSVATYRKRSPLRPAM